MADGAESVVIIIGHTTARYKDGEITSIAFCPAGSDAGYFYGPAVLFTGDESLDIKDVDGPFWKAVQKRLEDDPTIGWEE